MYDYLIVGSGLFGATFAHEAIKHGKKVMVLEQRNHIGGNIYTEKIENIHVHKYSGHIFHSNNKEVWDYINQFAKFNHFVNRVKAVYQDKIYSMPINLLTFNQIAGCKTPKDAEKYLSEHQIPCKNPKNLEDWIISQVGQEIYEVLIKGYTKKQWQRDPKNLPASIIRRLPIRLTYDDNYYNDCYQGIPIGGYTQIIQNMLEGSKTHCQATFSSKWDWEPYAKKLVYSGKIDEFFDYHYGELEYRTLRFEEEVLDGDFQGNAQMNYTDEAVPYTRIIEHKHFEFGTQPKTVITKEYPEAWDKSKIPYYPVNDDKNNSLYHKYYQLAKQCPKVIFGGRLGSFKYLDQDITIAQALNMAKKEFT